MTRAIYYPPADRTSQWFGSGNSTMPGITKLLWHTTETAGGWPGYGGGGSAPTLTYEPWQHKWRQHFPLNGSARALRDPSGTVVRENRDNIVQVEISCYCDPGLYNRYGHAVTDLDDQAYQDLADFSKFMRDQWGVPLTRRDLSFPPYPESLSNGLRMSGPQFDAYTGHLGHMHASGNTHGDPGNLDVDRILRLARGGTQEGELSAQDADRVIAEVRKLADRDFVDLNDKTRKALGWKGRKDNERFRESSVLSELLEIVVQLRDLEQEVQVQPEAGKRYWGQKDDKAHNRALGWVLNRQMNANVQMDSGVADLKRDVQEMKATLGTIVKALNAK